MRSIATLVIALIFPLTTFADDFCGRETVGTRLDFKSLNALFEKPNTEGTPVLLYRDGNYATAGTLRYAEPTEPDENGNSVMKTILQIEATSVSPSVETPLTIQKRVSDGSYIVIGKTDAYNCTLGSQVPQQQGVLGSSGSATVHNSFEINPLSIGGGGIF